MSQALFHPAVADKVCAAGVVAVLVVDEVNDAVPLARALLRGGIDTILTVDQLQAASEAGAAFGVSPGCNPRLLAAAREAIKARDWPAIESSARTAYQLGQSRRA